jgi:hypothetical protein
MYHGIRHVLLLLDIFSSQGALDAGSDCSQGLALIGAAHLHSQHSVTSTSFCAVLGLQGI